MHSVRTLAVILSFSLGTVACEDPAADKPKAAVASAKPVATTATSAAASAAPADKPADKPATAGIEKPAGALDLDPTSSIGFTGSKVTGKHDGVFQKFTGWIELKDGKVEGGRVGVTIDVASVKTDAEKLDSHLQTGDFFLASEHPEGTFVTTNIKAGAGEGGAKRDRGTTHTIEGNLKLRGVEKSVTFPATVDESGDVITAKAEFTINRKDWKIEYGGKPDDLIRDDVVIRLDLKAKKGG